jgi:hypothetical protein
MYTSYVPYYRHALDNVAILARRTSKAQLGIWERKHSRFNLLVFTEKIDTLQKILIHYLKCLFLAV